MIYILIIPILVYNRYIYHLVRICQRNDIIMDEILVKNDIINYQTSRNISIQYEEKLKLDLIIPNIAIISIS